MNLENTDELGLHELFCRVPRFVVCEDGRDVQISQEDMRIAVDRLCGGLQKWGINPVYWVDLSKNPPEIYS